MFRPPFIVYIAFFFSFFTTNLFAQNPGNIGTGNLTAWFKPDALGLGNVTTWTATLPAGPITLTETGGVYPQATNTPLNATSNYNMTVDFSGNATGASLKALENPTNLNLLNNNAAGNTSTFFCVYYLPSGSSGHMVTYRESTGALGDGIQLRSFGASGRLAIGATNSVNGSDDWTEENKPTIIGYKGNKSGAATMTSSKRSLNFAGGVASASTGDIGLRMGVQLNGGTYSSFFTGFISEVLFYNSTLTPAQASQVNTYLGVKYAITLDNTGGGTQGDYIATNAALIWDADLTAAYHTDVIGIGRDDNEALLQKQSHTFDDVTRIYLSSLAATNVANGGSFSNDISYVITGHNNGLVCATASSNIEVPASCGLYSRLEREWKVTKTNMTQNYNMDIKLSACGFPGSVNVSDLRFLVDDDGNFGNGGTTCYFNGDGSGIVISYANPIITVTGISDAMIASGTTRYVTIASINVITPLPVGLLNFDAYPVNNRYVNVEWETATEINNDYFDVQKSQDGNVWNFVEQVQGAGNSTSNLSYGIVDQSPFSGISYYRLKQVDFDGGSKFSPIRTIELINSMYHEFNVYPNPTNSIITIKGSKEELEFLSIYNSIGQEMKISSITKISDNALIIDLSELSQGLYIVKTSLNYKAIIKE